MWIGFGLPLTQGWWLYCHGQVNFRLNKTELASSFANIATKLWNHTNTEHKEGEHLEDRISVGASSCNSVDGTGQRVQCLIFMIMMMVVIPYTLLNHGQQQIFCSVHGSKIVITIMQMWKIFPSFRRNLKEKWINLMSAALHCLWFHY